MYGTAWKKDATTCLVETAVETGFRAIDTANQLKHYDEARVGDALKALYSRGTAREDLFLQTKFTNVNGQDHRLPYNPSAPLAQQVRQSMDSSLSHLHTDYVDSYVLHGPHFRHGLGPEDWEIWRAMEALYTAGKTRMLGISNVSAEQLAQLCAQAKFKPMVVQNRCYAALGWDYEVRQICRAHDIVYQGFSLLTANTREMHSAPIQVIAKKLEATPAQVVFRFAMYAGMLPLTGTTSKQHMTEDLHSTSLSLSDEEIKSIENVAAFR